ncbi:unnamed protein product, partial [Rotaria sp. Silwood2]
IAKFGYQQTMENIYMDKNELLYFLRLTRNQNMKHIDSLNQAQKVIDEFEMNTEFRERGFLSLDGFRNMLLSRNFDITESPLCDYYINTSHNTYLFYSQLSGDSNPEAYNRVLLMGCRALEFDCYDGDDGQPIVKHAFTLVKPCPFESIIRLIQPNLFKASPYPVIFNIENHCSPAQQKQLVRILENCLGDCLVTKHLSNKDLHVLPSPEDLKYRVLSVPVSTSKKLNETSSSEEDDECSSWNPSRKTKIKKFLFHGFRPLCDYYINTSHNTYLFYSQLSGDSNPEAYNRVLLMGCRALEFDCYDGDDGQPIVKHAFTLVKPCSFESIIRLIQPNLFKTSPYPVILNIENHCSPAQQKQLARILKNYLGDYLVTKHLSNQDLHVLPSPEDLKYRVLVRSVPVAKSKKSNETSSSEEASEHSSWNPSRKDVQSKLSDLFVYFMNVSYQENNYAEANYTSFHSSSLAENTFLKHAEKDPLDLILQTTWRLLRVYPDGLRQDSSNLDPIHPWNFGVQLVALNYQTDDDLMALYYGKFRDNGCCGYILKPDYLINAQETKFNPWNCPIDFDNPKILTITIISGQFLPRSSVKSKDIPDPYVRISTHGLPCDEKIQKTQVIKNNGFDPIWDETFEFRIRFPQMCLVYFSVIDYDPISGDDRIVYFSAPVEMIQPDYRHIYLRANNNDETHSTLFVHVDIRSDNNADHDFGIKNLIHSRL